MNTRLLSKLRFIEMAKISKELRKVYVGDVCSDIRGTVAWQKEMVNMENEKKSRRGCKGWGGVS